jgi:hypothetical protein
MWNKIYISFLQSSFLFATNSIPARWFLFFLSLSLHSFIHKRVKNNSFTFFTLVKWIFFCFFSRSFGKVVFREYVCEYVNAGNFHLLLSLFLIWCFCCHNRYFLLSLSLSHCVFNIWRILHIANLSKFSSQFHFHASRRYTLWYVCPLKNMNLMLYY